jgi:3-hydroxyisobutyrate dehydrogenase-like beta-hydroxyacid dehydrogenase
MLGFGNDNTALLKQAAEKTNAAKVVAAKEGSGAAAKASAATTVASTNESRGTSLSSSNKSGINLDALLDSLKPGAFTYSPASVRKTTTVMPPMIGKC